MKLQSPKWLMAIGVGATLLLVLAVVLLLALTVGQRAVSDNAALIAALVPLGGVFTAQMVSIALEDQRAREAHTLEDRRAREAHTLEDRRAREARTLEDQRAREARELETQRAHEAALQSYFEQVGELLMEKPLHRSSPGDSLSVIVRALTLTVLEGLDSERKRFLLQFLHESGLIMRDKPVVNLSFANLNGANLRGAILANANLDGALLSQAILKEAFLHHASLEGALLHEADLTRVHLPGANMTGARSITNEQLAKQTAFLKGATMPNGQQYEEWKDGENSAPP
jgi:uncharacterized protein YjbI with pentapeptide repeats